jgi:hypothetical protein
MIKFEKKNKKNHEVLVMSLYVLHVCFHMLVCVCVHVLDIHI